MNCDYVESDVKNSWGQMGGRYYVGYDGVLAWLKTSSQGPYSAALKRAQGYNEIHLSKKIYEILHRKF